MALETDSARLTAAEDEKRLDQKLQDDLTLNRAAHRKAAQQARDSLGTLIDRLEGVLREVRSRSERPAYVGRQEAASPATGLAKVHQQQQETLVREALGLA